MLTSVPISGKYTICRLETNTHKPVSAPRRAPPNGTEGLLEPYITIRLHYEASSIQPDSLCVSWLNRNLKLQTEITGKGASELFLLAQAFFLRLSAHSHKRGHLM